MISSRAWTASSRIALRDASTPQWRPDTLRSRRGVWTEFIVASFAHAVGGGVPAAHSKALACTTWRCGNVEDAAIRVNSRRWTTVIDRGGAVGTGIKIDYRTI